MSGNTFGHVFRVTTFGESHGGGLGVVVDGCPAGHPFPHARIAEQMARRRPGQGKLTSARQEADAVQVYSGLDPETGRTLGTPIMMMVGNSDARSHHYDDLAALYRPSHADYTYDARYGLRAVAGGGRASARETVGRVAAGTLAEDLLQALHGVEIVAWVAAVGDVELPAVDEATLTRAQVDASAVRCPEGHVAEAMTAVIEAARKQGDTVGGVVRCVVRGVPAGWGAPVFDKLTADLAKAMMSLPASRGFEVGDGFAATKLRGSQHNDPFVKDAESGQIRTTTNHSGGIQGGISNGEAIRLAVAFKPVATIFQPQQTVSRAGEAVTFQARGRHDPCVLPRAVPMVEAMAALVLCDHMLRARLATMDGLRR
ncbi:chorismate synthase [Nannocystis pusilla]|uniref:chorismate synthase n=1 Tax=Nannocystis pusilla TaxID=889268 RepID=UPI003BF25F2A